jgi:hypothetical protein
MHMLAAGFTLDDVATMTLDILDVATNTPMYASVSFVPLPTGWEADIPFLGKNTQYDFVVKAFDQSGVEIFHGSTIQALSADGTEVVVTLSPAKDGATQSLPSCKQITIPSQFKSGQSGNISFYVGAKPGEKIHYSIDAAQNGGSFIPASGDLTLYRDADGDGYGTSATTTQACSAPGGYVTNASDCNDGSSSIRPGATELCNGVDDNCNGFTDESYGLGGSCSVGTGACARSGSVICNGAGGTTCNASPGSPSAEVCGNGIDDNCNGQTDEQCTFADGASCSSNAQCSSGFCVGGICCNSACTDVCYSCDGNLNGGDPGICSPIMDGYGDSRCGSGKRCCSGYCLLYKLECYEEPRLLDHRIPDPRGAIPQPPRSFLDPAPRSACATAALNVAIVVIAPSPSPRVTSARAMAGDMPVTSVRTPSRRSASAVLLSMPATSASTSLVPVTSRMTTCAACARAPSSAASSTCAPRRASMAPMSGMTTTLSVMGRTGAESSTSRASCIRIISS